jgi:hypothetical protein
VGARCATSAISPAAPIHTICAGAPIAPTGTNTTCGVAISPAPSRMSRGAAGRIRAITAALRTGVANHDDARTTEGRIRAAAAAAGSPLTLG